MFARKFGRGKSSQVDQGEESETGDFLKPPPSRYDHRSASDPDHKLLASIPGHISNVNHPRQSSNADSTFLGIRDYLGFPSANSGQSSTEVYGLSLVHNTNTPDVDIIFVHGLGGSPRKTWSWNRDPDYFWPMWLPTDRELSNCRIFTFGYNANMRGPSSNLNILGFAKDLLLRMLTFSGGSEPLPAIGSHPIVFVAHSMGGLIIKKAYILSKNDEKYAKILSQIHGMVFLSTPHKGSNYAHTLNNILSVAPLGSQKLYIAELENNSASLQDINEQFRTICGDLILVSFYESLKTSLGAGVKKQIVESDSGVLGYPQETSSSLNADHHSICKYKTPEDPNYVDVKNMLKWMLSTKLAHRGKAHERPDTVPNPIRLEEILGIEDTADHDLNLYRAVAMEGSCRWITKRQSFVDWTNRSKKVADIFWLTGAPATGKSTLASHVVDYLQNSFFDKSCQYHFFLSGHEPKRRIAHCLLSIAFQLASFHETFRSALFALHAETGILFGPQKLNLIWEKIFEGLVFKTSFSGILFWVIDALDEADTPTVLIHLFMKIRSVTPIRVFMVSRVTKELAILTNSDDITHEPISETDTIQDIRGYVNNVVRSALPFDDDFQEDIANQVLAKASGSFLWVRLALDALKDNWHTEEDVRKVLHDVPAGMEALYEKMKVEVMNQPPRQYDMAYSILSWTACASRPLKLTELEVALESKFKRFVSLEDTIVQICGHFVTIQNSRIKLIHSTARQFLLNRKEAQLAWISRGQAHEHMALRCLEFLSEDKWNRIFPRTSEVTSDSRIVKRNWLVSSEVEYPFLSYAVGNWSFHISNSSPGSEILLSVLRIFLEQHCLAWIHAVALSGELRFITRAAQDLKAYGKKRARKSFSSLKTLRDEDTDFLRLWAVDLIRVVGKFGANLVEKPSSIHRMVPPFCPRGSRICETYGRVRDNSLSVSGLSSSDWDDCLARLDVGEDRIASKVLCTGSYFITLIGSSGTLVIWNAETCAETRRMEHREWVTVVATNKSGTLLATAGAETYRVWEIGTGRQIHCLPKYSQARAMALSFGSIDTELIIGRDDFSISCFNLISTEERWKFVAEEPGEKNYSCPRLVSFSPDNNKVAIACRGKPVLVWDISLKGAQRPRKCIRTEDRNKDEGYTLNAAEIVCWHPEGSLIILYQDNMVVDWRMLEEEQDEYDHLGAREMVISPDGNLLLTSDNNGTLSVWTFPRLHLFYRLHYDEFVRDLAFSPSGERFYDTRGSLCNVWEPDALIRPEELDREDTFSIPDSSILSEPIYSRDDNSRSQITALVCDTEDKFYCCGKDDGTINIHDMAEGKKIRKVYSHSTTVSIISLAWSLSGRYIVSGDDSGRVVAKRLESKENGRWAVFPVFDLRIDEPVEQLLFHSSEKLLLVSTRLGDRIWDLKAKKEICRRRWPSHTGRRWISHPLQENALLWIDPNQVQMFDWKSLDHIEKERKSPRLPSPIWKDLPSPIWKDKQKSSAPPERPPMPHSSSEPVEDAEQVHCISQTKNRRYIICEILPNTGHSRASSARSTRLELLPLTKVDFRNPETIMRQSMVQLVKGINRLIGNYLDRIAFLDHQYWLCTWEIDTDFSNIKRHFFLPKDWMSPSTLQLAVLSSHGTFLCPKNGEVGIVRNGVKQ